MGRLNVVRLTVAVRETAKSIKRCLGFFAIGRAVPDGQTAKPVTLRDYKRRMLRVLVHIQQRLDEPLELATLAQLAHFSPYHFHRVFTGMLGESVQGHVRRLRLERAALQLKTGNRTVTQIAFDAGYGTHESFTRAFKSLFGTAPSQYRALRAPAPRAGAAPSGVHYRERARMKNFRAVSLGDATMKVIVKICRPLRVAFVRHVGPYAQCSESWDRLGAFLGKEGRLGADTQFIGLCHDDPGVTPPDKIRYDACVTADDDFAPHDDTGVQTVAGGEYAVTTHFGPYEKLGETYSRLMGQWLPRSGRELRDVPCFDVYLNDPHGTAPEDLITDIHVPLKPRR